LSLYADYLNFSQKDRSYYGIEINAADLFASQYNGKKNVCKDFIADHFSKGGKASALFIPWSDDYEENGKHIHTVSLYLLGLCFQEIFSSPLRERLSQLIPTIDKIPCSDLGDSWYDFKYTWFLTCLYHDIASCIERTTLPLNPTERQKSLEYYLGELGICYTPYTHQPLNPYANLTRYSEKLVANYFYYRACCSEIDHGILGGYLLFDKLRKEFNKSSLHGKERCWFQFKTTSKDGDLLWRRDHLDHFAYIADAIICHNIWTANETKPADIETYKAFGLSPLIAKSVGKLSFREYPLHFMLCLFDSIEPTKRFEKISPKDVLNSISVELKSIEYPNTYELRISWDGYLDDKDGFQTWYTTLENMKNWLNINRISSNKNSEEIIYYFTL